jgi:hypothetical protein
MHSFNPDGTLKQIPSEPKPPILAVATALIAGLLFAAWLGSTYVVIYITAVTVYGLTGKA